MLCFVGCGGVYVVFVCYVGLVVCNSVAFGVGDFIDLLLICLLFCLMFLVWLLIVVFVSVVRYLNTLCCGVFVYLFICFVCWLGVAFISIVGIVFGWFGCLRLSCVVLFDFTLLPCFVRFGGMLLIVLLCLLRLLVGFWSWLSMIFDVYLGLIWFGFVWFCCCCFDWVDSGFKGVVMIMICVF